MLISDSPPTLDILASSFIAWREIPSCGLRAYQRNYRAVGILQGDTITWIWIGSHDDFDRAFPK
jgi:hypothetical protein